MSSPMDITTTSTSTAAAKAVSEAISHVLQQNFDIQSETCLKTCLKLIDGLLQHPYDAKYRTVKLDNAVIAQKIVACQGGVPLLQAIGFKRTSTTSPKILQFPEDTSAMPMEGLRQSRHLIAKTLQEELKVTKIPLMPTVALQAPLAVANFNPYQAQRLDQLAATTGHPSSIPPSSTYISPTEQQLTVLQQTQKLVEAKFQQQAQQSQQGDPALQHQWKAWRDTPILASGSSSTATAPDDTTTTTKSDAQLLAAHAKKQMEAAQAAQNQGFTTKAMRDLKRLQSQKVYGSTLLRIHFSDGSGVVGHFVPSTTIRDVVQALLQQVLLEDLDVQCKLFTTPPRTLLDPTKTLLELQLVPAAKLHVQWIQAPIMNASTIGGGRCQEGKGWFLRDEWIVQELSSSQQVLALPQGVSLVNNNNNNNSTTTSGEGSNTAVPPKKKKTKADKEKLLLQRMMGK